MLCLLSSSSHAFADTAPPLGGTIPTRKNSAVVTLTIITGDSPLEVNSSTGLCDFGVIDPLTYNDSSAYTIAHDFTLANNSKKAIIVSRVQGPDPRLTYDLPMIQKQLPVTVTPGNLITIQLYYKLLPLKIGALNVAASVFIANQAQPAATLELRGVLSDVVTFDPPLLDLPGGFLIVHLGMTGKLRWNAPREKHTHVIFTLEGGELTYTDARTFGRVEYSEELPERIARLGPDALVVPQAEFLARLQARTGKIKSRLLNQMFLRGLGNIYADEALFRAGIHPSSRTVSKKRAMALHAAIQEVLAAAVEARGSSISDYVDADNQRGSFQTEHRVYGRKGEPCVVCGTAIRRMVITQRSSHYCPMCQRR